MFPNSAEFRLALRLSRNSARVCWSDAFGLGLRKKSIQPRQVDFSFSLGRKEWNAFDLEICERMLRPDRGLRLESSFSIAATPIGPSRGLTTGSLRISSMRTSARRWAAVSGSFSGREARIETSRDFERKQCGEDRSMCSVVPLIESRSGDGQFSVKTVKEESGSRVATISVAPSIEIGNLWMLAFWTIHKQGRRWICMFNGDGLARAYKSKKKK